MATLRHCGSNGLNGARPSVARPPSHVRHLRFATYLAPCMYEVYEFIARRLAERLDITTDLVVGGPYDTLKDDCDVAFVCGLPYVQLASAIEPLAAPVLTDHRYDGRPVYYSDVIVRADSPFRDLADLQGRSWAYNEPQSQSGYGILRHHLLGMGARPGFFGRVVEAGWHEQSVRLVLAGEVDASAIDSQVLAVVCRNQPSYRDELRVIASLGPSPIQPVTVLRSLPPDLKNRLRQAFLELHQDPEARHYLQQGFVERFVPVGDADYDPIRAMCADAQRAEFMVL